MLIDSHTFSLYLWKFMKVTEKKARAISKPTNHQFFFWIEALEEVKRCWANACGNQINISWMEPSLVSKQSVQAFSNSIPQSLPRSVLLCVTAIFLILLFLCFASIYCCLLFNWRRTYSLDFWILFFCLSILWRRLLVVYLVDPSL